MKKSSFVLLFSTIFLFGCSSATTSIGSVNSSFSNDILTSNQSLNYSKALNHIKFSSFSADGDVYQVFSEFDDSEIKLQHLTSSFKDGIYSLKTDYIYEEFGFSETYVDTYYKGENGYAYTKELGIDNKVKEYPLTDNLGNYINFDDNYKNPFSNLRYTDFIVDGNHLVLKPKAQEKFLKHLLQWDSQATKTVFSIENDMFSAVEITTNSTSSSIGFASSYVFKMQFLYDINLSIPNIEPFQTKEEHLALKNALVKLADQMKDNNYTVVSDVIFTGSAASRLNYYVTNDAIYSDAQDENGYSYGAKKEENSMHEFYYDKTSLNVNYLDSFLPFEDFYLDYSTFAAELFDYDQIEKVYYLKDSYLRKIIRFITPYTESLYYSNYGYSLSVSLDAEGNFNNLHIQYSDSENMLNGESIITIEKIDSTALPSNIIL